MISPVYDPNRWKLGVTEIPAKPKQPPQPVKLKRKDALRAAWSKHFPHLALDDKQFHKLALIGYDAGIIDNALGKTAASASFGTNKQYLPGNVIAYARVIARCLAGNPKLSRRQRRRIKRNIYLDGPLPKTVGVTAE
jgi:hypothetical protein